MVCDTNGSDDLSFPLEEETVLVGVQFAPDQMDPSSDILHNILHLCEEWMQCQDSQ
jgi:hypothetical protein